MQCDLHDECGHDGRPNQCEGAGQCMGMDAFTSRAVVMHGSAGRTRRTPQKSGASRGRGEQSTKYSAASH